MATLHTHVEVNIERVNLPLRPIYVGQQSALKIHVLGDLPEGSGVTAVITPPGGGEPWKFPAYAKNDDRIVYVPGWAFINAGQASYEILAETPPKDGSSEPDNFWLGRGLLTVIGAVNFGSAPTPPPVPAGWWWKNRDDGLWYKVELVADADTGKSTIQIGVEGHESPRD